MYRRGLFQGIPQMLREGGRNFLSGDSNRYVITIKWIEYILFSPVGKSTLTHTGCLYHEVACTRCDVTLYFIRV
jgi:hypothetical protein